MQIWNELLGNHLLVAAVCGWLCAQVLKTIISAVVLHKLDWSLLTRDGGMPSGHSATVTALAVSAAIYCGPASPVFAVAAILAIIVMHDAMGVRREAGKHAKALNELFLAQQEMQPEDMLKEFLGHTPTQVFCGAVLGAVIAVLFAVL